MKWKHIKTLLRILLASTMVYLVVLPTYSYLSYSPQKGDLVFQSLPKMDLVVAIEGVTDSPYSHVGIVIEKDGSWVVREAIGAVIDTPLYLWIIRGRAGGLDVFRLKDAYKKNIPQLIVETNKYLGLPYDVQYEMDDKKIYCSELIYKAYRDATTQKMGTLFALGKMNWKPYQKTIEKYEKGAIPLERKMITPRHLSESKYLEKVLSVNMW
ncbi:hypothetical protein MNB_SV-13-1768 [hydrothermal vent metagenome]|uniref:Peptidoglycan peptidase n=1 Tax=hydrothermal vent metagenome TaxID=652676 RepID=A0A1W1CIJ4_9ZZZZ